MDTLLIMDGVTTGELNLTIATGDTLTTMEMVVTMATHTVETTTETESLLVEVILRTMRQEIIVVA